MFKLLERPEEDLEAVKTEDPSLMYRTKPFYSYEWAMKGHGEGRLLNLASDVMLGQTGPKMLF